PSAQSNRWYSPYQAGVKAYEAGEFQKAVAELEEAIAADPRAAANKYVEGVFRTDYFPYFYLGASYLKLGRLDLAQQNFRRARDPLPRNLRAPLADFERELAAARASSTPAPPPERAVAAPE